MSHISPVLWQFLVHWIQNFAIFPPEASTIAPYADALYFALVGMTITGLVLVMTMVTVLLPALSQRTASGGSPD